MGFKRLPETVALIISLSVFFYSGWQVYSIYHEYEAGKKVYAGTAVHVNVKEGRISSSSSAAPKDDESTEEEIDDEPHWTEDQSVPDVEIDHDALLAENPDYIGWFLMESLNTSYPICQGDDNEYYLHHAFDGSTNVNGCLFLDSENPADLSDFNSFLYGHNMKNGTMFGSLKKLLSDPTIWGTDPYFYIFKPEAVYKYHIYSYYITPPDSKSFHYCLSLDEYEQYLDMVVPQSIKDCHEPITVKDRSMTLSTCSGTGENKKRLLIHGKLVGIIEN